jgi:hypothetical protein
MEKRRYFFSYSGFDKLFFLAAAAAADGGVR